MKIDLLSLLSLNHSPFPHTFVAVTSFFQYISDREFRRVLGADESVVAEQVSCEDAEDLLSPGAYLIRPGDRGGEFWLSYKLFGGRCVHTRLQKQNTSYKIDGLVYSSLKTALKSLGFTLAVVDTAGNDRVAHNLRAAAEVTTLPDAFRDGFAAVFSARNATLYTLSATQAQWTPSVKQAVVSLLVNVNDDCFFAVSQPLTEDIAVWLPLERPYTVEVHARSFVTLTFGNNSHHAYAVRFTAPTAAASFGDVINKLAAHEPVPRLSEGAGAVGGAGAVAAHAPLSAAEARRVAGPTVVKYLQTMLVAHGNAGLVRDFVYLLQSPLFDMRMNAQGTMLDNAAVLGKADVVLELLRLGATASLRSLQSLMTIDDFRVDHLACAMALISYGALPPSGNPLDSVLAGQQLPYKSPALRRLLRLLASSCRGWPMGELRAAAKLERGEAGINDVVQLTTALTQCLTLVDKWKALGAAPTIAADIQPGSLVCAIKAVEASGNGELPLGLSDVVSVRAVYNVSGWLECEAPDGRIGFVRPDAVRVTDIKTGQSLPASVEQDAVCEGEMLTAMLQARYSAALLARTSTRSFDQLLEEVRDLAAAARFLASADALGGAATSAAPPVADEAEPDYSKLFNINGDAILSAAEPKHAYHHPLSWTKSRELTVHGHAVYLRRVLRCGVLTVAPKQRTAIGAGGGPAVADAASPPPPPPPPPPPVSDAEHGAAAKGEAVKVRGWADADLVLDCGFLTMFVGASDARCKAWPVVNDTEEGSELFHRRLQGPSESAVLFRHHVCHLRASVSAPPSKAVRLYKSLNARVLALTSGSDTSGAADCALEQLYQEKEERSYHRATFPTAPAWLALTLGVAPTVYVPMSSVDEATAWVRDIETMSLLSADSKVLVDLSTEWVRMHLLQAASLVNGIDAPLCVADRSFIARVLSVQSSAQHRTAALLGSTSLKVVAAAMRCDASAGEPLSALKALAAVLGRPSLSLAASNVVWTKYGELSYQQLPPRATAARAVGSAGSGGVLAVIDAENRSLGAKEAMQLATTAAVQYDHLPRAAASPAGSGLTIPVEQDDVSANALWTAAAPDNVPEATHPTIAAGGDQWDLPDNWPAYGVPNKSAYGNGGYGSVDAVNAEAYRTGAANDATYQVLPDNVVGRTPGHAGIYGMVSSSAAAATDDDDADDDRDGKRKQADYSQIRLEPAPPDGKGLLGRMRSKLVKMAGKMRSSKKLAASEGVDVSALPEFDFTMAVDALRDAFEHLLYQIDIADWAKRYALEAVAHGDVAATREIALRHRDALPSDLLAVAINSKQLEVAAALVDLGFDPMVTDEHGTSILALLCRHKPKATERSIYVALLQLALGDGTSANCPANWTSAHDGLAPLHVAVMQRNHVAIGFLVGKRGVDVNVRERERTFTPLHLAASLDDQDIVNHLLRHGSNPYLVASELQWDGEALAWRTAPPGSSGSALDVARACGHKKTARLLDARQRRDQTTLCRAAAARTLTAADLALALRRSKCYLYYVDGDGRSLLHWLVASDSASLIEQLFESPEAASLLEKRDRYDLAPIDIACQNACYDAALVLLNAGARIEPVRSSLLASGPRFDFLPLFEEQVRGARIQSAALSASTAVGRLAASALSGSASASASLAASRMRSSAAAAAAAAVHADAAPSGAATGGNARVRVAEAIHQRELQLQRDLEQLMYFWGYLTAAECNSVLLHNGAYLLRNGPLHRFVISFMSNGAIYHTFITVHAQRGLCIGPPRSDALYQSSLHDLLRMHAVLATPVVNPRWSAERARLAAVSLAAGAHLTPDGMFDLSDVTTAVRRGASTVVALLAYTARSEHEVTFEPADVMLLIHGMAHDDWVRVLHNGRVGFVPSSHVVFDARAAEALWEHVSSGDSTLTIKPRERLIVLSHDESSGWCFCLRGKDFGFVPRGFLKISDNSPMPRDGAKDSAAAAAATAASSDATSSMPATPSSGTAAVTPARMSVPALDSSGDSVKKSSERLQLAISSAGSHVFGDGDDDDGDDDGDADADDKADMVAVADDAPLPQLPSLPNNGGDDDDDDGGDDFEKRRSSMPLPPLPSVPPPSIAAYLDRDDSTPIAVRRVPVSSSSSQNRAEYWRDVVDTASAAMSKHSNDYVDNDEPQNVLEWSAALTSALQEFEDVVQVQPTEVIGGMRWTPPRCPRGHTLTADVDSGERSWYCDSCHDQRSGVRMQCCKVCDFDLCERCTEVASVKPAEFAKLQLSATGMRPLCVRGHAMSRAPNADNRSCVDCRWRYPATALVLSCEQCTEVVCRRCAGEGSWWLAPPRESLADKNAAMAVAASEERRLTLSTGSLFTAATYNDLKLLRLELRCGAHVLERWVDGASPLHTAAWYGHWRVLRELIDRFGVPSVDLVDSAGSTPLMHAVLRGHVDTVSYLILRGADTERALQHALDADSVSPLILALLTGSVPARMPKDDEDDDDVDKSGSGSNSISSSANHGNAGGDRVMSLAKSAETRPFLESWSAAGRQRQSHLHAHRLVAVVHNSAWQCDGARLFGCWQPTVRPGDVRFVCAEGCEFALCRVCVDGSEASETLESESSSEHAAMYGFWSRDLLWTSMSLHPDFSPSGCSLSAQIVLSAGLLPRTVTVYLNRSLTVTVSVTLRIDTSYADVERACREAYATARARAHKRRQRHALADSAVAAEDAVDVGDLPPLPKLGESASAKRFADGDDDDGDGDSASTVRRCVYVADEDTLLPFGNLALSEHGPLATDARLRLAKGTFLYIYMPHESQVEANERRLASSSKPADDGAVSLGTDLSAFSWYVPSATRDSAEQLLRLRPPRSFLVRPARLSSQLAVSIVAGSGAVVHSLLERSADGFWWADFGAKRMRAASLPALLNSIGVRSFDETRARTAASTEGMPAMIVPCSPLSALMRSPPRASDVHKYSELVKCALLHGANVNAADERTSNTPLLTATLFGNEVGALLLLRETGRNGIVAVNVNARNELGETALHHAARLGQRRVVQSLSRRGAEIEAQTRSGALPLDVADQRDADLVQALAPDLMPRSLMHLPDEVLLTLLRRLPWPDLLNVSRVCRRLAVVTRDLSLWPTFNVAYDATWDSELMAEVGKRVTDDRSLLSSVFGVAGARSSGKSALIRALSSLPPAAVAESGTISGYVENSFTQNFVARARLCEHGAFGGVGDIDPANYKGAIDFLNNTPRLDGVIVCFDAMSRASWHVASEWLKAVQLINAERRQEAAAREQQQRQALEKDRQNNEARTVDALFCDALHVLESFDRARTSVWYNHAVHMPVRCRACWSSLSVSLMQSEGALVCTDCSFVLCAKCSGEVALTAAHARYSAYVLRSSRPKASNDVRQLSMIVLANARTSSEFESASDLLVDETLMAEAEALSQHVGASLWALDVARTGSVASLGAYLVRQVLERAVAPLLREKNILYHRAALRETLLSRTADTSGPASTSAYALLPFAPANDAAVAAAGTVAVGTAVASASHSYDVDDDDNGDDDHANDGRLGKEMAGAAKSHGSIVRALLQTRLRSAPLIDGGSRISSRARLTGEMLCSRGHALVRSVFTPQPNIEAASGALFKVTAMSAVAPLTVDGLTLAIGDIIDVLELPSTQGGLALGCLDGRVGRFPIDVCKSVPKSDADAAARSIMRKCSMCSYSISLQAPTLSCFSCREYVCRACSGDVAFATAARADWAFKTSEVSYLAESLRDIVDEKRREVPLEVPLAGVVLVLRDGSKQTVSRRVVAIGPEGGNVWPETRAVLCAAGDGRVGYLPLLALDGTARSVITQSRRYRIQAAYHRGMCLIRATSGVAASDDRVDLPDVRLGDYFVCHSCPYRFSDGLTAPMIVCGVCRVRCHAGHRLQPMFDSDHETACECGAHAGRHESSLDTDFSVANCCALYERGAESELPKRSVRMSEATYASNSPACFFEGQVLDVVEDVTPRPGFVAVRDPLLFTGVSFVRAQSVTFMRAFPTAAHSLISDKQARQQRKSHFS